MKRELLWVALAALLLPIAARFIWFYPGVPTRPEISTPDYDSLTIPQPPLETSDVQREIEIKAMGGIVILDNTHTNQFQPGEIDSLKRAVEARDGKLEFLTDSSLLENHLKYASAYVVISPSIAFAAAEMHAIEAFVARGGRLLVFTDATRGVMYYDYISGNTIMASDVNAVNPLLANFGITVNNDYLYNLVENEGNFRNVFFDDFGKDELTFGLKQVAFYGTHSVKSDLGLVLLPGAESTLSSVTDAHNSTEGGAVLSEDGNVIVFGDFTFLTPPYNNVADNPTLINNLADFLLGGERTVSLANFPYIFSQPTLQVFPTSKVQMTAEMIASLGRLQASLKMVDTTMQITSEEPSDGDTLVLGTFTASDDLVAYAELFDITLDEFSEFVETPGFGNVGRAGNGILLFDAGTRGNTIILLAESMDDLTYLLDTVSSGDLTGCLIQGDIGVCSVGFGGTFSEELATEPVATGEATDSEATPAPTPMTDG